MSEKHTCEYTVYSEETGAFTRTFTVCSKNAKYQHKEKCYCAHHYHYAKYETMIKEKCDCITALQSALAECNQKATEAIHAFHIAAAYRLQEPEYTVVDVLLHSIQTIATLATPKDAGESEVKDV